MLQWLIVRISETFFAICVSSDVRLDVFGTRFLFLCSSAGLSISVSVSEQIS